MSKVRREKHKDLVLYQIFSKRLDRYNNWHPNFPRWRQSAKVGYEYLIREFKK